MTPMVLHSDLASLLPVVRFVFDRYQEYPNHYFILPYNPHPHKPAPIDSTPTLSSGSEQLERPFCDSILTNRQTSAGAHTQDHSSMTSTVEGEKPNLAPALADLYVHSSRSGF